MKRTGLISCIAAVLLTNGMALLHAVRARSGVQTRAITLTERELPPEWMEIDDSGVALKLAWKYRTPAEPSQKWGIRNPLDKNSLENLGFSIPSPGDWWAMRRPLSALRYAVFELDSTAESVHENPEPVSDGRPQPGPGYAGRTAAASSHSRLTFLEASNDLQLLWGKYADQEKYLISRVAITRNPVAMGVDSRLKPEIMEWRGRISEVFPSMIVVPSPFSRELKVKLSSTSKPTPYRVALKYGRDLEPWVTGVQ